jgi:hypothetical protein
MTIATNVTWASAIKHHPDFQKSTENLGSFASIINDPSLDAATCLRNLGNEPDPIIIFPSAIDQRPLAIHNLDDPPPLDLRPNYANRPQLPHQNCLRRRPSHPNGHHLSPTRTGLYRSRLDGSGHWLHSPPNPIQTVQLLPTATAPIQEETYNTVPLILRSPS